MYKFKQLIYFAHRNRKSFRMEAKKRKMLDQNNGDGGDGANKIPIRTLYVGPIKVDVSHSLWRHTVYINSISFVLNSSILMLIVFRSH